MAALKGQKAIGSRLVARASTRSSQQLSESMCVIIASSLQRRGAGVRFPSCISQDSAPSISISTFQFPIVVSSASFSTKPQSLSSSVRLFQAILDSARLNHEALSPAAVLRHRPSPPRTRNKNFRALPPPENSNLLRRPSAYTHFGQLLLVCAPLRHSRHDAPLPPSHIDATHPALRPTSQRDDHGVEQRVH